MDLDGDLLVSEGPLHALVLKRVVLAARLSEGGVRGEGHVLAPVALAGRGSGGEERREVHASTGTQP